MGTSPEWSFAIAALSEVVGQKIALDGGLPQHGQDVRRSSSTATARRSALQPGARHPDLSWDRVPGASLYQVWVNTDASFTTPMEPERRSRRRPTRCTYPT